MTPVCLYLQAHQPFRIRTLSFFEIGENPVLFDQPLNKKILNRVTVNSYLPAFEMFGRLIKKTKGEFRFGMSMTGVWLEQVAANEPDCLRSLQKLTSTGAVEILGETYYHTFASLYSSREFEEQIKAHREATGKYFNAEPSVFRNAELAFRSDMIGVVESTGYHSIFIEGSERTLKGKSGNYLYSTPSGKGLKIFTRNQEYSNLISGTGMGVKRKRDFPEIKELIRNIADEEGDIVNIWFDIECIGEHQKASTGIFEFFEAFISEAIRSGKIQFMLPGEAQKKFKPKGTIEVYSPVTWHVKSNDISAWNGNAMQIEAVKYLYGIENKLRLSGNPDILDQWRKLQSTDHLLYMDTAENERGRPAQQFSPYKSPHDAYIYLMNALASLELQAGNGG